MKDKPNKLDGIIREKMNDLGGSYRPETWDWLNERLDAEAGTVDPLDEVVRDKLAQMAAPYRPETWDWMNERLEAMDDGTPAGAEMQPMDEAIYESMHRLEKPYDPNHWPLLLKKLEGNAYVGERIIRYKAMELSLLVLLLITFIRLPFTSENTPRVPAQEFQQHRPQAANESGINQDRPLAEAAIPKVDGSHTGTLKQTAADITTNLSDPSVENNIGLAGAGPGSDLSSIDIPAESGQPATFATTGRSNSFSLDRIDLSKLPSAKRTIPVPREKLPFAVTQRRVNLPVNALVSGSKSNNFLGVMAYLPTSPVNPTCLTCKEQMGGEALEVKHATFFRIGMQGGPDYNRVITPSTTIRGENYQADRYSLGYSGGLTLGLEKGRWEIETGLIYSNKRYYALPVLVLDGSVEDGFFGDGTKQFDLDVFQVPLNFRYNFIRKNRWRIYAMAGMSLHVTTQSNYYLAEANGFTTEDFRPQPTRPGQENNGRNAPSIRSEFDNFTKGWLEGGAFSKNSFLTGNAGVGIERFITDYWSIYAQPTYAHSLIYLNSGLGPYYDRIHTNSLIFGVKVRLK